MEESFVSFQENGARIYTNEMPPKGYPFLRNPDRSLTLGIPPHRWVMDKEKNRLLPALETEKGTRFKYEEPSIPSFKSALIKAFIASLFLSAVSGAIGFGFGSGVIKIGPQTTIESK